MLLRVLYSLQRNEYKTTEQIMFIIYIIFMPTVQFRSVQPSIVYYAAVFTNTPTGVVFYDSNYFSFQPHNEDAINYNLNDYIILICLTGDNYYLANVLLADTDMSTAGYVMINMTFGAVKIDQIINFSAIVSSTLAVTKTTFNINNYVLPIDSTNFSTCQYYIFGDMSNSVTGYHNNEYVSGHNICVDPSLYQYISNLLNSTSLPQAPAPDQIHKPSAPVPHHKPPTPAPNPPANSNTGIIIAVIVIALIIIFALIIFGGLMYKKKKSIKKLK
jgi:hypothetical protein